VKKCLEYSLCGRGQHSPNGESNLALADSVGARHKVPLAESIRSRVSLRSEAQRRWQRREGFPDKPETPHIVYSFRLECV
jgi:hypothetical protein